MRISDRVGDLANEDSVLILGLFQASEHLSTICKELHGEQSEAYWRQFSAWRELFWEGKVLQVIGELKRIRDGWKGERRDLLWGEIRYSQDNPQRMRCDRYRAMRLPIGTGMLQIRTSLASGRLLPDSRPTLRGAA